MHAIAERLKAVHVPPGTLRQIQQALAGVHDADLDLAAFVVGRCAVREQIGELPNPFPADSDDAKLWTARFEEGRKLQQGALDDHRELRRKLGYRVTRW